jgi:Zn finger protein HypA/HybF involved in hydrogenase expression
MSDVTPTWYECPRCGHRAAPGDRTSVCPDCGGEMDNVAVRRE